MNPSPHRHLLLTVRILLIVLGVWLQLAPVAGQNSTSCGTKDEELSDDLIHTMRTAASARKADETLKLCRVAVAIDSETYRMSGRDTSLIWKMVLENIAYCSKQLEEQVNIRLVVTDIRIWKDANTDPFFGSRSVNYWLSKLWSLRSDVDQFDKLMLLYMGSSSDYVGVANMPGRYSVSPLQNAEVVLHELGHNFSSPHTHNCNWPGGAIDYCFQPEGNCSSALENSLRGTIMSYCQGRSTDFHPLSRQMIRLHAEQMFKDILSSPAKAELAYQSRLPPDGFVSWPASYGASEYHLEFHEVGGGDEVKKVTTRYNGWVIRELTPGKDYHVRINAVNEWGESGWTNPVRWSIATPTSDAPPAIVHPISDLKPVKMGRSVALSYLPVPGASHYEVEVTQVVDLRFNTPAFRVITSDTQVIFEHDQHTAFKWRVRTVGDAGPGRWSDVGFFSMWPGFAASRFRIPVQNLTRVPTTFPFSYMPFTQNPKVTLTISEHQDMSAPLVRIVHDQPTSQFTGTISDLPKGRKLYLQLEEQNSNSWDYPTAYIANIVIEFTTTAETLPPGIQFSSHMAIPPEGPISQLLYTSGRVWYMSPFEGIRSVHTEDLSNDLHDVRSTNGAWGITQPSFMAVSKDGHLKLLAKSSEGYRYTSAPSNDLSGELEVTRIFDAGNITGFNPDLDLFWQNTRLYQLSGNTLREIGNLPDHLGITDVQLVGDFFYLRVFDGSLGSNRILRAKQNAFLTLEAAESIQAPWASRSVQQMERSLDGKLWVLSGFPSMLTSVDASGTPTSYPYPAGGAIDGINSFYISPHGTPYVAVYDASYHLVVHRWESGTWKQVGNKVPLYAFSGSLVVDENENFWISNIYGLTRISSCEVEEVPVLEEVPEYAIYNQSVTLRASGCSEGTIWTWRDEAGTNGQLEGEEVSVTLLNDTWFILKCMAGCPGSERSFQVRVLPVLTIEKLDKSAACLGDNVSAFFGVEGNLHSEEALAVSFVKNGTAERTTASFEWSEEGVGSFKVPDELNPGEYQVFLHSEAREQAVGGGVTLLVVEQPTASLFTDKTQVFQKTESAEITVNFTGTAPWVFTDWDGKSVETSANPFVGYFIAAEVEAYELKVSNLSDQFCHHGIVNNSVTITGILVLSTEPGAVTIDVFPNPAATTLTIRSKNGRLTGNFFLVAADGRTVRSLTVDSEEVPMSLSGLSPGVYVLWTEIDGHRYRWKIVK